MQWQAGRIAEFRSSLLTWFEAHKRPLPWRTGSSLYKTVVSEFMLQQTQVDTVLPYFERWMATFPDFETLAEAPESQVLKAWEGLGYYSRARNLHKLASSICEEGIPESAEDWKARPGIGPYTAAAISSMAQNRPEPVIDGNVIRVLARLTNDAQPFKSAAEGQKRLAGLARHLIDPQSPGAYNEAIMELGAVVCRKARPACLICPVQPFCEAAVHGTQEHLPVMVRKATRQRSIHRLWLVQDDALLLQVYPKDARRLAGMAELPALKEDPGTQPMLSRSRGISTERIREYIHALPATHTLAQACIATSGHRFVPIANLPQISLSGPHWRWIEQLLN